MSTRPLDEVLRSVAVIIKLLGTVAAAAVPLLVPDRLVPFQLEPTRAAASMLAALGFIIAWAWYEPVTKRLRPLAIATLATALILVVLNQSLVVTIRSGAAAEATHVLVGFKYTEEGEERLRNAEEWGESRREQLQSLGTDQVAFLWGWSYYATAVIYTLTIWLLLLAGTATLVATDAKNQPNPT